MRGVETGKMAQIYIFHSKWPTFCGPGTITLRGYFVRLGMTKACTEFRLPTQNGMGKFVGGATE